MENIIYELKIKSDNALELFKEFAFDLGVVCIEENENYFIIRDEENVQNFKFAFEQYSQKLSEAFGHKIDLDIKISQINNKDWIEEYKKGVAPIEVGEFYIHPSWEEEKDGFINILIEPALAFGSGHHESTNMCLNLISKYAKNHKNALDVGCGSGILSIAMAKLGLSVDACDTDKLAIDATNENSSKNLVKLSNTWVGSVKNNKKYSVVVANIIADVILILKNDLINSLEDDGVLILSGILERYKDRIMQNFSSLKMLECSQKNEWLSFVFKKER